MAFSKLRPNSKSGCGYYGDKCVEGWSSCGKCKKIKGKQASRVRRQEGKELIREELENFSEKLIASQKNIDKEFVDIVNNNFWELFE